MVYSYGILLSTVSNTINQDWLPWFHDAYFAHSFKAIGENVKPLVVLACYISLASIGFAPEAIHILGGAKYADGVYCVLPVVLGVLCQFIYGHYVNIELHLKKTMFVSYDTIIAALFNLLLNSVYIPKYGYIAAAYTTLASYFVLMFIHFCFTRYLLKVSLYNNGFMFGSMLLTSIVAMIVFSSYGNTIYRYSIIAIGFFCFVFTFRNYFGVVFNFVKAKLGFF